MNPARQLFTISVAFALALPIASVWPKSLRNEIAKYRKVVKAAGIKPE